MARRDAPRLTTFGFHKPCSPFFQLAPHPHSPTTRNPHSELLKNLVLSGFADIEVIDLDTIDVSNLNRQFLFRKKDVGQPKSLIAKDSVLRFNPSSGIQIKSHLGNVKDPALFNADYVKGFSCVANALDNISRAEARERYMRRCPGTSDGGRIDGVRGADECAHRPCQRMLPVSAKGGPKKASHLHHSLHPKQTRPLHRVGQTLILPAFWQQGGFDAGGGAGADEDAASVAAKSSQADLNAKEGLEVDNDGYA